MNIDALTARERQVFDQLVLGKTNAQIAAVVKMSEKSVKGHLTQIFRKTRATHRAQVVARYYLEQPA